MVRIRKVLVLGVLFLLASTLAFAGGQKDDGMMKKDGMQKDTMQDGSMSKDDGMMQGESAMKHDDGMMSKDDSMQNDMMFPKDTGMMGMDKTAQVLSFTDLATAAKHVKNGPTVLFFAASWCPDCRALVKSLHEGKVSLPPDLTLIVVDYDKSMDLKTKYGVTYQHTFVQIDGAGNKTGIWNAVDLSTINMKVVRGVM